MQKFIKALIAGVVGASATQAAARIPLEDELYQATLDQRTLAAAEVFTNTFPDSKFAGEIDALVNELILIQVRNPSFEPGESLLAKHGQKKAKGARNNRGKGYSKGKSQRKGKGHHKGKGKGHHKGKGKGHGRY